MRTINSFKNIVFALLFQITLISLGFFTRRIFLDSLGIEYLGISSLLTNILAMLGLVELGIGGSIVYSLYKPLVDQNKEQIIALVQLYKRIYSYIALAVLVLSGILYLFIDVFIHQNEQIPNLTWVYFLFVGKNMISYLNAYKWSLISADQKEYVLTRLNIIFQLVTSVIKIYLLIVTKNYILYLSIEFVSLFIQNIFVGRIVEKYYPYIQTKIKYAVDKHTEKNLIGNIKAMFFHSIGSFCVFSTDNILISILINVKTVGLYSNYSIIFGYVNSFLAPFMSVKSSIANLIISENKETVYKVFKAMHFMNFWLYTVGISILLVVTEPFIDVWMGKGLGIDRITFYILLLSFYISGMRGIVSSTKIAAGIFKEDKYMPLIESAINLIASFTLGKLIGLPGIFLGTIISTLLVPFSVQSKLVYRIVLHKPWTLYLKTYLTYSLITLSVCVINYYTSSYINLSNPWVSLIAKGIVCVVISNLILASIYFRTDEFKFLLNKVKDILGKYIPGMTINQNI